MRNSAFINVVPSFLLRSINPSDVLEKYQRGHFSTIQRRTNKLTEIKVTPISVIELSSTSIEEPIFTFKDKNGHSRLFAFSNQKEYTAYIQGKSMEYKCNYCFHKFMVHPGQDELPERIPLYMEDKYIRKENNIYKLTVVWGEGTYCHPNCCYTAIHRQCRTYYKFNDATYNNSELYYKAICSLRYPGIKLQEVDVKLLDIFGGTLTYEEWRDKNYKYEKVPNMIIVPVKIAYEKLNVT